MIQNEHRGEPSSAPPTSGEWLAEPGPVWYTPPAAKSGHANGAARPARLVRSLDDRAWIALLLPDGRWQRQQARPARLALRTEVLELDRVWAAAQGTNGGAFTSGAREVPDSAVSGTPAREEASSTSPCAGLAIAAEPGWVRAGGAALQCPHCGATGSRRGTKFRSSRDLRHHQTMAHRSPDPAAEPIECPDCRATCSKRGQKFRDSGHLAQHRKRCARRAAKAAPPAETPAPEVHQNGRAPAPTTGEATARSGGGHRAVDAVAGGGSATADENGSAAQPSPAQVVRFCVGCGLNLEVLPMPVRFCPACGLGTAAIHAALSAQPRGERMIAH